MPTVPSNNRFRNRNLSDCHREGAIMLVRCARCRREARYLPADLIEVLGDPHWEAFRPPLWPCSRCRTAEHLTIRSLYPTAEERAAGITVRRPVERVTRWRWREEKI